MGKSARRAFRTGPLHRPIVGRGNAAGDRTGFQRGRREPVPGQARRPEDRLFLPGLRQPVQACGRDPLHSGRALRRDPFLLFRLRGRTQEQILQALRQRRAGQMEMVDKKLQKRRLSFRWRIAWSISGNWARRWRISRSAFVRPLMEMPLLKRLGEAAFIPEPGIETLLRAAYQTIGQEAIRAAFQEEEKKTPKFKQKVKKELPTMLIDL